MENTRIFGLSKTQMIYQESTLIKNGSNFAKMELMKNSNIFICIILICIILSSCETYNAAKQIKIYNHSNLSILVYVKESYPDVTLNNDDLNTIISYSSKIDSESLMGAIINPNGHQTASINQYCDKDVWAHHLKKDTLIIYVFNQTILAHNNPLDIWKVKKALLRTLLLTYNDLTKNGCKVDYYR